jgi:hypothetical protein
MFCPTDVNTGFIQLVGPIQQKDLNTITIKSYPLSISFAPRTIIPSLIGNRIDESTENTCTFKGQRFSLVDVQICSVANIGYSLPGQTDKPVAELIISFSANVDFSGGELPASIVMGDLDGDGKADWMEVVAIFKQYGWTWGGDWKFKDAPHFEKTFGYSTRSLLNLYNSGKVDKNNYVLI